MYKNKSIFFIICETPVHAGSGESIGYVDLPLQRDVVKEIPIIQPSGVKGSLRDFLEDIDKKNVEILFGPEDGSEYSSCISLTEAKILFFPIKSIFGLFGYITAPHIINEFFRFLKIINPEINNFPAIPNIPDNESLVTNKEQLILKKDEKVYLGEFVFDIKEVELKINNTDLFEYFKNLIFPDNEEYRYWKDNFTKRAVILSDNVFKDIVNLSTEKVTRNRVNDETGVVDEKGGGLWDEENLPSDTILYSALFVSDPYKENKLISNSKDGFDWLKQNLDKKRIQIGGHKTIGRGFVFVKFI